MPKLTVAFIDDGINSGYIPRNVPVVHYHSQGGVFITNETPPGISHGTACYSVFNRHVTEPYSLVSIKVMHTNDHSGNAADLVSALKWCACNKIDLINISLGTYQVNDRTPIYRAVREVIESGKIIVAACNNRNTLTYPACFEDVIGVKHSAEIIKKNAFYYNANPYDGVDVTVSADTFNNYSAANSLAAPIISARIAEYMTEGCVRLPDIRARLQIDSLGSLPPCKLDLKEITCPVIGIPKSDTSHVEKTARLVSLFLEDEYCAVGLSSYLKTAVESHIFNIKEDVWESLNRYYNFAEPDIIFLNTDEDNLLYVNKLNPFDIILAENDFDNIQTIDIRMNPQYIFQKIKELLE